MIELAPRQSAEARRALDDIAVALEHPPPPSDGDKLLATSLYSREPGWAVFYAYLDRATPRAAWRKLANRYLTRAITAVPRVSNRPFFSYGFSGTAWAVQHLSGWFVAIEPDTLDDIDEGLTMLVDRAPTVSFDLQHGLVGFGLYALERLPAPRARRLLEAVIARLAATVEPRGEGLAWKMVTAEWVESRYLREILRGVYPTDAVNGSAGVIGLLGGAIAAGIAVDDARRLLAGALAWQSTHARVRLRGGEAQLAWARGALGMAAITHAAASAAGLERWIDVSLAAARSIARARGGALRDAGFDRGVAGTVHMFHRLFLATRDERFADAARRYVARLLRRRQPGVGLAGYRLYSPVYQRAYLRDPKHPAGWIGAPGLLRGVAGIGLVLLAVLDQADPSWDRALLLSYR